MPGSPTWSAALAVLLAVQSAGGLFLRGLYRDNAWVAATWRANDLVTLVVAAPMLVLSLVLARRGSAGARLVWLGMVYYALYNNMYYLFGAAFNGFFLVYVAILVLSGGSLILALARCGLERTGARLEPGAPRRAIAGFMWALAATLGVMWIGQCLLYVVGGRVPQIVTDSGHVTNLAAALDLSLIVPPLVAGGMALRRGRAWGVVAAGGLLIQCSVTCLVLIVSAPVQAAAGIRDAWALEPLWLVLGAGCVASAVMLLRGVGQTGQGVGG